MPFKPVDAAIKVIVGPAIDDTDFKSREETLAFNQAGMEIDVILEKHDGTIITTAVTPTAAGNYDWAHTDQGFYELELPASGGASFNNTEEGMITVVAYCTGVLPFGSITYDVIPTMVYDSLVKGTDNLLVDLTAATIDDILDEVIGDAVHATPNSFGAMLHAVYCRFMQKRTATDLAEVAYKLDDATPLKNFTLGDDGTTTSRT